MRIGEFWEEEKFGLQLSPRQRGSKMRMPADERYQAMWLTQTKIMDLFKMQELVNKKPDQIGQPVYD